MIYRINILKDRKKIKLNYWKNKKKQKNNGRRYNVGKRVRKELKIKETSGENAKEKMN